MESITSVGNRELWSVKTRQKDKTDLEKIYFCGYQNSKKSKIRHF